jgi:mutator protein MutT
MHTIIEAAGGIVKNNNDEILMIYRRGKWDLPKGKIDEGETPQQAAIREVQEETGLQEVKLGNFISITEHTYYDKWLHKEVLKKTWWYEMYYNGTDKLIPQSSEDITEAIWANKASVKECMTNSYKNIVDLLNSYLQ